MGHGAIEQDLDPFNLGLKGELGEATADGFDLRKFGHGGLSGIVSVGGLTLIDREFMPID